MRIGHGYDVHALVPGRDLILGGVKIPYELGLEGHSDADVLRGWETSVFTSRIRICATRARIRGSCWTV